MVGFPQWVEMNQGLQLCSFFSDLDPRRLALLEDSGKLMYRNENPPALCLCWACVVRGASTAIAVLIHRGTERGG